MAAKLNLISDSEARQIRLELVRILLSVPDILELEVENQKTILEQYFDYVVKGTK